MLLKKFLGMKASNFIKKRLQYRFHSDDTKSLKRFLNDVNKKVC